MTALVKLKTPAPETEVKPEDVLIHVRFFSNGEIATIDRRPEHLDAQEWYLRLRKTATQYYQTLAGGRGFFRIPRNVFDSIPSESAA